MNITRTPNQYEPLYTDSMAFVFDSITFSSYENYKYIVSVYQIEFLQPDILLTTIATYPRPDYTGIYSPHEVLKTKVDTIIDPFIIASPIENKSNRVIYNINLSEQYKPGITFSDTYFVSGFVGLTFGSTNISTELFVGDLITLSMDGVSVNLQTGNTASITQIVSNNLIKTDKPWTANTTAESGMITNLFRVGPDSSNLYAWNASRNEGELSNTYFDDYIQSGTSSLFLTSYGGEYKDVFSNNWETIDLMILDSVFISPSLLNPPRLFLEFSYYDSSNNLLGQEFKQDLTDQRLLRWAWGVGPSNFGPVGLSFSGLISTYEIQSGLGTFSSTSPVIYISDKKKYRIVEDCGVWDNVRLVFLNPLGGYDYLNCNKKSSRTISIKKNEINRAINPKPTSTHTIQPGQRGLDYIWGSSDEVWVVNTDILDDDGALFVSDCVSSLSAYMVKEDTQELIPIIITDSSFVIKTALNNGIVQYSITFRIAKTKIINR
jgi:hypothetical protein